MPKRLLNSEPIKVIDLNGIYPQCRKNKYIQLAKDVAVTVAVALTFMSLIWLVGNSIAGPAIDEQHEIQRAEDMPISNEIKRRMEWQTE